MNLPTASIMPFADRTDAGRRLAERLLRLDLPDPVALALPRGGVPVAAEVARALNAPLDLVIVRKLGMPGHAELAAGAIADGDPPVRVLNDTVLRMAGIGPADLDPVIARETAELARRRAAYLGAGPRLPLAGRSAIVIDDGIATGATMRAALRAVRQAGPRRLILAVPVAPADVLADLATEADEVICLLRPDPFLAVGAHYADFEQVSDDRVIAALTPPPPAGSRA